MPWIPSGGLDLALIWSSSAFSARSTWGRRLLLCPLRSSLSTCAFSIGPMMVAPLVGAQDSIARVGDLSQIGTDETARGQAIHSLPTEPDGRKSKITATAKRKSNERECSLVGGFVGVLASSTMVTISIEPGVAQEAVHRFGAYGIPEGHGRTNRREARKVGSATDIWIS